MKPILFKDCFGWLHPAEGGRGVVMCGAHGQEELLTHRAWRGLAARLAARGLPTLRFDYHATGDSAGAELQPGQVRGWLDSVRGAVEWMRTEAGVKDVALVGLRLGALLAAVTADEMGGVDSMALLATCTSGKAFLHEVRALARFAAVDIASTVPKPAPRPEWEGDLEAAGFVFTPATQNDLKRLDLQTLGGAPARRLLLLNRPDVKLPPLLTERLRRQGAAVREEVFGEFPDLLRTALGAPVPAASFDLVADWIRDGAPAGTATPVAAFPESVRLQQPGFLDEPVFLDPRHRLFGLYCRPARARPADPERPVVVFFNNGALRHVGSNRMWVMLARRMAERGLPSLRFDIAGIGESAPMETRGDNIVYCEESYADVATALGWLAARGHRRVIAVGLCSGATLALQAAVRDERVIAQVLVNPGRFFLGRGGTTLEIENGTARQVNDYVKLLFKWEAWKRLLTGQRRPGVLAAAIVRRSLKRAGLQAVALASRVQGKGPANKVLELFQQASRRKLDTLLLYSEGDFTLAELETHLGPHGGKLAGLAHVRFGYLPHADHTLTQRHAREDLFERIETFLADHLDPVPLPAADERVGKAV